MIHYGLLLLIGTLAVPMEAATVVNTTLEGPSPDSNDSKVATCPAHYVLLGNECLRFDLLVSGTWEEMRAFCQSQDAALVNLLDPHFYVDIIHHLRSVDTWADFWIGATDLEEEGQWVWLDGSPVDMNTPYWAIVGSSSYSQNPDGGTSQNCALLSGEMYHFFNDKECTLIAHPICQLQ